LPHRRDGLVEQLRHVGVHIVEASENKPGLITGLAPRTSGFRVTSGRPASPARP
jgi:hypothetical protein